MVDVEDFAQDHGISISKDNIDKLAQKLAEEVDYLEGDEVMARGLVESEVMEQMELKDILDWKVDSFVKWDDNPGTGADAHAYFEKDAGGILDQVVEDHSISWYCRQGRQGYEVTNEREEDDYRILTLRET